MIFFMKDRTRASNKVHRHVTGYNYISNGKITYLLSKNKIMIKCTSVAHCGGGVQNYNTKNITIIIF